MIPPSIPDNEKERLRELASYSIMDTLSEEEYDNLTAIASTICNTSISLVSLIDDTRQWFKSHHGLDATETPKEYAFCGHAINDPQNVLIVNDSREDERFFDNPLVEGDPYVIFYAGVPLVSQAGLPLGTLCVIDNEPKTLSQDQIASLKALANQVIKLLELRKSNLLLEENEKRLNQKNKELERFAFIAAHDLKSPISNLEAFSNIINDVCGNNLGDDCMEMLSHINISSAKIRLLIDGLLEHSRNGDLIAESKTIVLVDHLMDDLKDIVDRASMANIRLVSALEEIEVNKTALLQILLNLTTNAIKYNDKESIEIEIGIDEDDSNYIFHVQDNGPGIPSEHHQSIFEIFNTLQQRDRFGHSGTGIGLATVKDLITRLGGEISVKSTKNKGAKFSFTLRK